jgi:DeoR/GlpR family transcriptional regulator of sugar metabolism
MLVEQQDQIYEPFRLDASFEVREDRFTKEKHRIAKAAALMVQEGERLLRRSENNIHRTSEGFSH